MQKNLSGQIESLSQEKQTIVEKSEEEITSLTKDVQETEAKLANANETIVSLQSNMDIVKETVNSLVVEKSRLLHDISLKVVHLA